MTTNTQKTKSYFEHWDNYSALVNSLDTYSKIRSAMQDYVVGQVLDIGSGGIVDYKIEKVTELTLLDLTPIPVIPAFVNENQNPIPVNIIQGTACKLDLPDNTYDTVVMKMVLHHLAEPTVQQTYKALDDVISESLRVLKPGGRIVIVETVLSSVGYFFQKNFYTSWQKCLSLIGHPVVFQFSLNDLRNRLQSTCLSEFKIEQISTGRWMIQLGIVWPTILSPLTPYVFTGIKK